MAAPHPLSPVNAEVKNAGSVSRRVQRVLVTGGAGFLGSHLCERLLGLGHEVCRRALFLHLRFGAPRV